MKAQSMLLIDAAIFIPVISAVVSIVNIQVSEAVSADVRGNRDSFTSAFFIDLAICARVGS